MRASPVRKSWISLASAVLAGSFVLAGAADASAAERCTTKPAVCARLKAVERARGSADVDAVMVRARPEPLVAARASDRCTTKPAVCARLSGSRTQPSVTPVQLATGSDGARCATKPAVCARLKMRDAREPVTLAGN